MATINNYKYTLTNNNDKQYKQSVLSFSTPFNIEQTHTMMCACTTHQLLLSLEYFFKILQTIRSVIFISVISIWNYLLNITTMCYLGLINLFMSIST